MKSSFRERYSSALPSRIFLDGSHTCASGKNSGIERVVRSLLAECRNWCEDEGVPIPQLVVHEEGKFYRVEKEIQKHFSRLGSIESNVRRRLPSWYTGVCGWLCRVTMSPRLKKWLLPEAGHLGIFKLAHNLYDMSLRRTLPWFATAVTPGENDLFLLPDAYWTRRGVWQAAENARQSGATITTLIYDLIPLTHPQYVGTKRMEGFRKYLHNAIEHSDMIVAISRTVQEDVQAYIQDHRSSFRNVPRFVKHFKLGAELSLVQGEVRPAVRALFQSESEHDSPKNPYLMVATFDPRKNHHYLLDAFDLLWKTRSDLRLCLIGRVGSLCEDVVSRIRSHPALNKQLFAFYDIKDAELQHCYQHCRGVVFPSIVEGFGLPIVESLWFGKRTFASDTPIHREVGQDDCVYFDLSTPKSLASEIERWESLAVSHSSRLPTRRPTTWAESSRQLIACCLETHGAMRSGDSKAARAA
jgi:O-antigen biosynthesis alpha-1,2-rhamnosyltransferase